MCSVEPDSARGPQYISRKPRVTKKSASARRPGPSLGSRAARFRSKEAESTRSRDRLLLQAASQWPDGFRSCPGSWLSDLLGRFLRGGESAPKEAGGGQQVCRSRVVGNPESSIGVSSRHDVTWSPGGRGASQVGEEGGGDERKRNEREEKKKGRKKRDEEEEKERGTETHP